MVRRTIAWLAAAFALSSHEWAQTYLAAEEHSYVPVDLLNYPDEAKAAHPSQKLTIFYPDSPPTQPNGLYPTLLYSPAACFQEADHVCRLLPDSGASRGVGQRPRFLVVILS